MGVWWTIEFLLKITLLLLNIALGVAIVLGVVFMSFLIYEQWHDYRGYRHFR